MRARWQKNTFRARWASGAGWLPRLVAFIPANIYSKLLSAFLIIVALLITVGAVGLRALSEANRRDEELLALQKKITAYRNLQQETTNQLNSVALDFLATDEQNLDTTLRQLNQFSYAEERIEFVSQDEVELLDQIKKDHDQFRKIETQVIELIPTGKTTEALDRQGTA